MNDALQSANPTLFIFWVLVVLCYAFLSWNTFGGGRFSALSLTRRTDSTLTSKKLSIVYWTSPFLVLAIWGLVSYVDPSTGRWFPAPDAMLRAAWRLLITGTLLDETWISLQRILIGFSFAAVVGVALGLGAGTFLVARQILLPVNSFLRYIPPTAFIALLIVYFGVGETYKYAVVFFGIVFYITQMVIDVVDDIDLRHVEMAQTCGFRTNDIFWRVILPCSAPRVLDVLRINLGAAWTFLVAAELIGADRGLGHLVAVSQRFMRLPDLYVGILTFGVIGMASDRVLDLLGRRVFRWYDVSLRRTER